MFELYGASKAALEFEYIGEVGTGLGPTSEFFTLVSRELQKTKLDMWRNEKLPNTIAMQNSLDETITNDDERTNSSEYVYCPSGLFPAPLPIISNDNNSAELVAKQEKMFYFLGSFVARALQDNRLVDLPFSQIFLKIMLNSKNYNVNSSNPSSNNPRFLQGGHLTNSNRVLCFHDIKFIDSDLYRQLKKFLNICETRDRIQSDSTKNDKQKRDLIQELKFDKASISDLCLDFTLPGYPHIQLKPSGDQLSVDVFNLHEYVELVARCTLVDGIAPQVNAFRRGFNDVFNIEQLAVFSPSELQHILCGCAEDWTEDMLIKSTKCDHGFSHSSRAVKFLFTVLCEMSPEEKRAFLRFVTGTPQLPVGGLSALRPKLTIVRKTADQGTHDEYLPSVMTCAHYIKLPDYTSLEILKQRLFYAINEGQHSFLLS